MPTKHEADLSERIAIFFCGVFFLASVILSLNGWTSTEASGVSVGGDVVKVDKLPYPMLLPDISQMA